MCEKFIFGKLKKKGFVAATTVDLWAIVSFVLIVFLFFVIFKIQGDKIEVKIDDYQVAVGNDLELLNLMRAPIVVEGKNVQVVDLIRLYYHDSVKYNDLLYNLVGGVIENMDYRSYIPSSTVRREYTLTLNVAGDGGGADFIELRSGGWKREGHSVKYFDAESKTTIEYKTVFDKKASVIIPLNKTNVVVATLESELIE